MVTMVPLIRRHHFSHITSLLEDCNVKASRILSAHGIPEWQYGGPQTPIPLVHFVKTLGLAANAAGDEKLGIHIAGKNPLQHLLDFSQTVKSAITVYDAIMKTCDFAPNVATTLRFWLKSVPGGAWFCRQQSLPTPGLELGLRLLEQRTMTLLVQIVRLGAGSEWNPKYACLSMHNKSTLPADWEELTDTTLFYQSTFSGIFVPDDVLCLPITSGDFYAYDEENTAAPLTWNASEDQQFLDLIDLATRSLLEQGFANLDMMAEVLCCSTRSLQRRLAEHNTTFRQVVGRTRYNQAVELLDDANISIQEISDKLD